MRSTTIIVTYNHGAHIERCLSTLLPTLSLDDDVIVVDNASADGTADAVAQSFPSVRLIRNAHNVGFGSACNQAARETTADYLAFLNPDTEPRLGWIDALLASLQARPDAGLATPKLLLMSNPRRIDTFGHDIHISGIATCRGWDEPAESYSEPQEVPAISGACFAVSHRRFDQLGGFDEQLFLYYEDDDLSLRARLAGNVCLAVPAAQVLHDHSPGFSPRKLRYLERNRLWTTLKVYRSRTLLRLIPTLLGAEVIGLGMACYSGPAHVAAKLLAWCDVLRWLPALPHARSTVQRSVSDADILRAHGARLRFRQVVSGPVAERAERLTEVTFALLSAR
jgi:GT2 family glycosyltransferase